MINYNFNKKIATVTFKKPKEKITVKLVPACDLESDTVLGYDVPLFKNKIVTRKENLKNDTSK